MTTYERLVETVRQRGERLTFQRRLVMRALCEHEAHMTIHDIQRQIQARDGAPDCAEPTIYRIVQWLKDLGLVSQTDMSGAGIVYQVISTPPHHHLICLHCGTIVDIDDRLFEGLRRQLNEAYGFRARIDHMAIYGWCARCAAESSG
jgi:Fur family transcriptional regulator, ferric uptake regulator